MLFGTRAQCSRFTFIYFYFSEACFTEEELKKISENTVERNVVIKIPNQILFLRQIVSTMIEYSITQCITISREFILENNIKLYNLNRIKQTFSDIPSFFASYRIFSAPNFLNPGFGSFFDPLIELMSRKSLIFISL